MSLVDEVATLQKNAAKSANKDDQLKKLEEVVETLEKMGVSLEPTFDIPLKSRVIVSSS